MPAIKTFIRSLAQAFGISSPQQARQVACTWTPPSKTRSETDPDQATAAAAATKKRMKDLDPPTSGPIFLREEHERAWVC
jgi:hypothetical protein